MAEPSAVSVIIPAFDEEGAIPQVIASLRAAAPWREIIVVDDGSTDRTGEVARGHGCEVISFGTNRGLPAGIAAGYEHALEHG